MHKFFVHFQKQSPKRIALWACICVLCVLLTIVVLHYTGSITQNIYTVIPQSQGEDTIQLSPGDTLSQEFTARGRIGGLWIGLNLDMKLKNRYTGTVFVTLTDLDTDFVHLERTVDPKVMSGENELPLPEIFIASGKHYALTFTNNTDAPITLRYNPVVQSGALLLNGQQQTGYLNYAVTRISSYEPTPLFYLMLLTVNFVVMAAAWMVLFSNIKTHFLYLFLAVGFGFVMLFDLTSMYGHDMQFHFDSTYVVSNKLMGMEGTVVTPSLEDPESDYLSYYRRFGDDYTSFCLYPFDFISANYTDTYRGFRDFRVSDRDAAPFLTETYQNAVGEQLYLYLPQAVGFTIARLLGLGFYPMLQLARILAYAVFVALTYWGIKAAPFGKRLLLILALMPATLIQAVSISRDAMIIAMCFYLIPKVFSVAYGDKMPTTGDWIQVMVASVILAPCKIAYVPVSFLWLLIIYRKYILEQKWSWKKAVSTSALMALPVLIFFLLANISAFATVIRAEKPGLDGTPAYTVFGVLTQPKLFLFLLFNTIRTYMGTYLTNAVQLFALDLGSGDGITLIVFSLLILEVFSEEAGKQAIRKEEKGYGVLVLVGVFLLLHVASISWTPNSSDVIQGLQGRYLIPVLPLLGYAFFGSSLLKSGKQTDLIVRLGCCVFPAVVLMNIYLWSINPSIDLSMIARFC